MGIHGIEESSTYQAILRKGYEQGLHRGRAEEARRFLLRAGRKKFGEPGISLEAAIRYITDLDRLERLADGVDDASSWQDLFALE
jgi:hypothetical protein